MGKQRGKVLSRKAEEIYELYPDKFSADFEHNKRALDELNILPSKINRNLAAGYITRLAKKKKD